MRIPALAILTTGTLSWLQSKTVCASQTCSLRNVIQLPFGSPRLVMPEHALLA
jgi:hypothetical protein